MDFFLVALPYTLLDQQVLDSEFPRCAEKGIGFVIGAVFASGILATGAVQGVRYAYWTGRALMRPTGETRRGNITFVGADMRTWRPARAHVDRVAFVSSFSPCDDAACSGARWFKDQGVAGLAISVELFATGRDWISWLGVPGFCEHPRSTISTYYRAPDHKFNPCDYTAIEPGDNYTKETWIWGYNGFVMPPPRRDPTLGVADDRIHKAPPGPDRKNFRSATPVGFAREVFRVNVHSPVRKAAAE